MFGFPRRMRKMRVKMRKLPTLHSEVVLVLIHPAAPYGAYDQSTGSSDQLARINGQNFCHRWLCALRTSRMCYWMLHTFYGMVRRFCCFRECDYLRRNHYCGLCVVLTQCKD